MSKLRVFHAAEQLRGTRRRVLGLFAAAPIAGKVAIDTEIARVTNADISGLGDASLALPNRAKGLGVARGVSNPSEESYVPYEKRLINAAEYLDLFGMPAEVEYELRDRASAVHRLDIDLANKKSWSMAVKFADQKQRNYEREVDWIKKFGWI